MLESTPPRRSAKQRGAYPTPPWLVDEVVRHTLGPVTPGQRVVVLDPACGDGRFLTAADGMLRSAGANPVLRGVDNDPAALALARRHLAAADLVLADALGAGVDALAPGSADVVVGNPPFLSPLAATTTRRGASEPAAARTPTPPPSSSPWPSGRPRPGWRTRRTGPPAVAAGLPRRRSRPGRGRPPGHDDLVVVVAAPGVRRRQRPRLRPGLRAADGCHAGAGAVDGRRRRRPRGPGPADPVDRRSAGRPGPADGQLPRPVLRAGPGRRRAGSRRTADHQRADRPGTMQVG